MRSLQTLLTILDGQHLSAGYLTPSGTGTALETVIALMTQMNPILLAGTPITPPALLFTPAWVAVAQGQNAIFLNGLDGNLDLSHGKQPAYVLA
jgi:hypothetical protein